MSAHEIESTLLPEFHRRLLEHAMQLIRDGVPAPERARILLDLRNAMQAWAYDILWAQDIWSYRNPAADDAQTMR